MNTGPTRPLYKHMASIVLAISNCIASGNKEWECRHGNSLDQLVENFMPSGSGIDCGTKLDLDACLRLPGQKLVFGLSFHHVNENGMYDDWTEHRVIITPCLCSGFNLRITGPDRNDIKEYLNDVYHHVLSTPVYQTSDGEWHDATPKPQPKEAVS